MEDWRLADSAIRRGCSAIRGCWCSVPAKENLKIGVEQLSYRNRTRYSQRPVIPEARSKSGFIIVEKRTSLEVDSSLVQSRLGFPPSVCDWSDGSSGRA
ncbi:hypothetical protein EUGRSUZ_J02284 [Eucalyptus grandis]|uniref:Uncharacterized protein n=2 Tax=Eucalyptus grandis TaxID=71139 RepID=A0ACC3J7P9_EUCGR|nr:hypothetical protein EUGRSUZ_J02284 [Eucalyptus grandis]